MKIEVKDDISSNTTEMSNFAKGFAKALNFEP